MQSKQMQYVLVFLVVGKQVFVVVVVVKFLFSFWPLASVFQLHE